MEDYVATQPAAECSRYPPKNRPPGPSRTIATTGSPVSGLGRQFKAARAIETICRGSPTGRAKASDEIEAFAVGGCVPALLAIAGLVTIDSLADIGIAEIDAFDFRLFSSDQVHT